MSVPRHKAFVLLFSLSIAACANFDSDGGYAGALLLGGGGNGGAGNSANPGFQLTYDTALLTSESGSTATLNLSLTSAPTGTVQIPLSVTDAGEASVSSDLYFSTADWNLPKTITLTGVDDATVDGNQNYSLVIGPARSGDGAYDFLPVATLSAINTDDDGTARVTVSPLSGLVTTESGGTADFLVVLNTPPTLNVNVTPLSSDTSEAASPGALVFTPSNWSVPQKVTVTGADDNLADGAVAYTVTFSVTSGDPAYNLLPVTDIPALANSDNDTPGITVSPTSGLAVTEGLATDTFTVVLDSEPTANVVIGLSSGDATEGSVSPASLTFTAGNWNTPQTVTVTGVNDFIIDGNRTFSILTAAATSADSNYNGMDAADVSVINGDDDTAGFLVTPVAGLSTAETATTDTFTLRLTSEPTANVVIGLSSDNTAEGTVSPASLTFTSANWMTPQTVTLTGVNDSPPVADGAQTYNIVTAAAVSTDTDYNGLDPADVSATNANDDNVAFVVTPAASLITTEGGGTVTINIKLATFPAGNVTLGSAGMADLIRSLDLTEATVSPSTLTWTPAQWNTDKAITVTGVADGAVDANTAYQIDLGVGESAGDPFYNGLAPPDSNGGTAGDLTLSNCDTNTADRVSQCSEPGAGALTTTEGGGSATTAYILTQAPTASVTVPFSSADTTEYTVTPGSLTFTTGNWFTPQTVTLTGVNDSQDDGNIVSTLTVGALTSSDGYYSGYDPADPSTTNTDNDTRGFTVSGVSGNTDENGTTATFTLRLRTQPLPAAGTIVIGLSSLDTTEVTVSPATLTFNAAGAGGCGGGGDWCTNQTVTLTGVDDALVADGNIAVTIQTDADTATATDYNGVNPADRTVTNLDNDKRVFVTASTHNGDFDNDAGLTGGGAVNADGNAMGEADRFCALDGSNPGGTYKAMLVDGTNRSASPATDWVFTANYNYYRAADSAILFTADGSAIFSFGTLTNPFHTGAAGYWTGLNFDWTSLATDCTDWTTTAAVTGGDGDGTLTGTGSINNATPACAVARSLVCVEQ